MNLFHVTTSEEYSETFIYTYHRSQIGMHKNIAIITHNKSITIDSNLGKHLFKKIINQPQKDDLPYMETSIFQIHLKEHLCQQHLINMQS